MQATIPAPIWRQLLAMLYDSLCVLGLLTLATALMLPGHHYKSFEPGSISYQLVLVSITFLYFYYFWRYSQQTIGMRAWSIRIASVEGTAPTITQCLQRFLASIPAILLLGLGVWWQLFDKDKRSLQDKLSKTQLLM